MKLLKKLLLPFLVVTLLVGCSSSEKPAGEEPTKTADDGACGDDNVCALEDPQAQETYDTIINENKTFQKTDMETILNLFREKKDGIVYLGFTKCPWCLEAIPVLDEVAKANNKNILYFQTRDDEKKLLYTDEEKQEMISFTKEHLDKDDEGEYQLYVPFVFVVEKGEIVSANIGTVDDHDAHERKMTEDEITQLKETYTAMLS